jgi:uncharacterized protein YecT (DUF1311 family)
MVNALNSRKHRPARRENAMNSTPATAALTATQRAWINALAPAFVLIAIALMGLLG